MGNFAAVFSLIICILVAIVSLAIIAIKKNYAVGACGLMLALLVVLGGFALKSKINEKNSEQSQKASDTTAAATNSSENLAAETNSEETAAESTQAPAENTAQPTQKPAESTQAATAAPTATKAPETTKAAEATKLVTVTPVPKGDYTEVHYDASTIVKPDNWNGKTIYLTFDDGPSETTKRVLDNLATYNVKCTFFVCNFDSYYEEYVKRALDEGHSVGVHCYEHEYDVIYASVDAYLTDFNKLVTKMHERLGYNPTIMRFPGGASNGVSKKYCTGIMTELTTIMPERGYVYFDWNVSPEDAMSKMSVDAIVAAIKKEVINTSSNNKIVLMHDYGGMENSADAALEIIKWGLAEGYAFDRLTPETTPYQHKVNN